ncbi:hypothetical protein PIB30_074543 [Stylosanthes scabra]|uniref:Aminotransferase-like plant mobile domain-containing protein n=1 Tax=Stylosanthes scabra TaxID=79078 RepID=A0ABU6QQS4_9FABA|nr:hypothetical protein [Stylosanthes scabra]
MSRRGAGRGTVILDEDINKLNNTSMWRLETHSFHLLWGECTIALQDVAYRPGLRIDGDPVSGCVRDFQQWYRRGTWHIVEDILGAKSPPVGEGKNYAGVKMT